MCPGHFDVRPSQVRQLRSCRVLLRFDFQKSLDGRLGKLTDAGLTIREVRTPGGLCEPACYLAACRQVGQALTSAGLIHDRRAEQRLAALAERMRRCEARCRRQIARAGLEQRPVVASAHQAAFCRFLGLRVAATFRAADVASVGRIDQAVRAAEHADARLIVANLPEGRRLADALAERLQAQVVVFGNFPTGRGAAAFEELVAANLSKLLKAARSE